MKKVWKLNDPRTWRVSTPGVMANVLDSGLKVSEFKLQWHYYVYFQTNAPWKKYDPFTFIPPAIA